MAEASEYFLSETELTATFEEKVKPYVFSGRRQSGQDEPLTLVLLGAQPAAGKTQAMNATRQRYEDADLVPLTGDRLRAFHPRIEELRNEAPEVYEAATAQASGPWVRMSIEHALENRYSLLLEGIFRDPELTVGTADRFARAGFRVEVVALAVREERSRLDGLYRFLNPEGEPSRWTPPQLQDLAYRMTPQTIADAEASPSVQRITITNRTGQDLYFNERTETGAWRDRPAAVRALLDERALPLPPGEALGWLQRYRDVLVAFAAEGHINDISQDVLRRLTNDADTVAAMAHPEPEDPRRAAHDAAQPLLRSLIEEPPAADGPLSLMLQDELQLSDYQARLDRGVDAATEVAQLPSTTDFSGFAQRLADQGYPPDLVGRAQNSAAEDREYAQQIAAQARDRLARLQHHQGTVEREVGRRAQLTPEQRQVEDSIRWQLRTAQAALLQQEAPQARRDAPRIQGPQHPSSGRGVPGPTSL